MTPPTFHPIFSLTLLALLSHITAALPTCSPLFGHPDFTSCTELLMGTVGSTGRVTTRGISRIDRKDHLFALPIVMLRPPAITRPQWSNREYLPQPLLLDVVQPVASLSGPVPWANEGCAAAVLPGRNEMTGELSYDTGRYVNIAAMGLQINSHCVSTPAVGGLGNGVGGYVRTGDNNDLIIVLYQPGSQWETQMKAREVAKQPLYIDEDEDDDAGQPDQKRIKQNTSATGSSTAGTSIQIGGDWLFHLNTFAAIDPSVDATSGLVAFYNSVSTDAFAQLSAGAVAVGDILYTLGEVALRLSCKDGIYWDWVVDFAEAMIDATTAGNPMLYVATAVSALQAETITAELMLGGVALKKRR